MRFYAQVEKLALLGASTASLVRGEMARAWIPDCSFSSQLKRK